MNVPYDFQQAREAAARASRAQEEAERNMRDAARALGEAEERYRVALAKRIVELHAEGTAWSVCGDVARGDERVARLRRERDIQEGVREAMVHAAWRRAADRRDTERFVEFSLRRELAIDGGRAGEPQERPVFGGRRVA